MAGVGCDAGGPVDGRGEDAIPKQTKSLLQSGKLSVKDTPKTKFYAPYQEQWAIWLEGVRRFGTALYLFAIALGLGTIIHVLRFQAIRIRELATQTNR